MGVGVLGFGVKGCLLWIPIYWGELRIPHLPEHHLFEPSEMSRSGSGCGSRTSRDVQSGLACAARSSLTSGIPKSWNIWYWQAREGVIVRREEII